MHHLLLGIDPTELGGAPFALPTDGALDSGRASSISRSHPGARVYVLPCIAGHVGADTAGVVLVGAAASQRRADAARRCRHQCRDRARQPRSACSPARRPTGPAFEGAQISCGQRAAPGAIERVRIDRATLEPRFKVIGCDLWSDEPGFARRPRAIGVTGVCGSGIIEAIAEMFLAGIITPGRRRSTAALAARTRADRSRTAAPSPMLLHEGEPAIRITQNDVRAIQLAKAALYAGAAC